MMMKKVSYMAAPMVAVSVSTYLLQVISMVMAGHLDELSLSSVAIATCLTNVTGFSLLVGFSGALETLCGQAFGAEQYRKIGSYTYSSMICLVLICFPISLLWVYMDKLLELFHQDPLISELACRYSIWLIPALFGCALLQPMTRYFQSQGLVLPLFLSSFGALCFHIPLCWFLVYKLRFGIVGAALSIGVSLWFNVALLWVFMRDSALYRETNNLQPQEIFSSMKQYISLAIPSAMMICLEWWSFEILLLLSGLLPNSKLETSVMSICLTTSALHYVLVDAIGAAASTHVSNELGAGNPKAARAAANAALYLGAFDASFVCITLYSYRKTWAYIFSNEVEVAHYATKITPILCLSIFICSSTAVLSGIARGAGWQRIAGICKHRIILSGWYTCGFNLMFYCEIERERTLDCLTTSALHYVLVDAIGAAASTHVSNELGAGNPKAARAAANAALYLGAFDASFVCITLYSYRKTWAYIFSNEVEVAHYATKITPILCLSIFICSSTAVLSGIARGAGWQRIAGICKHRIILSGCFSQTMVLALVTFFTNWEQEATKARDRVLEMTPKGNQETEIIKEDAQVLLSDISENV
ncbi:hypothetical protein F2Q69_00050901 [Brassica cretica]|uniref:Protein DETOXIFICATION n=1 Tax=Brassica cretica TaxID=69181 RepID=A0A8S9PSZ9_BRACR|nr:hypothetical protein F2Q69_00050901 [Brassica cretica]